MKYSSLFAAVERRVTLLPPIGRSGGGGCRPVGNNDVMLIESERFYFLFSVNCNLPNLIIRDIFYIFIALVQYVIILYYGILF